MSKTPNAQRAACTPAPAGSEILMTPIAVSVHRKCDNPIFGENVIKVSVDDEAAGPFIVLTSNASAGTDEFRIDVDELEAVVIAARQLIAGLPNNAMLTVSGERKGGSNP